jgi:hypothetical protein
VNRSAVAIPMRTTHPRVRVLAGRVAGIALVLAATGLITVLAHRRATSGVVNYLARYSPAALEHGRIVTLPASAFLVGRPRMLGPTTFFVVLLLVPYALAKGVGKAARAGLAGHCLSTLVIAAVALPGAALGWATANTVAHQADYGASAALAAVAGALAVLLFRRWPAAGLLVAGVVVWIFVSSLMKYADLGHNVADVEHLVAVAVGASIEWFLP